MSRLIYLSHPFGGQTANLERAVEWLAWAHEYTEWGLWVQAPWIASAAAEGTRGTTEEQWVAAGGVAVERATLRGFGGVLHAGTPVVYSAALEDLGRDAYQYSTGQQREARFMASLMNRDMTRAGRVWRVETDLAHPPAHTLPIIETTGEWR